MTATIWDKFTVGDGCWEWRPQSRGKRNYGQWQPSAGVNLRAHRAVYEMFHGPIPPGLDASHLCDNPPCVRPSHILPESHRDNQRRIPRIAAQIARTHCPQGHPYDEANTRIRASGKRECRTCDRNRHRKA